MQPMTFVFFGIVGSGKGTQVKLLQKSLKDKDGLEQVYVGTGEIFRKIIESDSDNDPSKQAIKELLNKGQLIPDDMTNELVSGVIKTQLSSSMHLFMDGYPRTVNQSMLFEDMMNTYKRGTVKIIYIEVGKEEALKRNLLRGRHDDTEEGLAKRFDEYVNNVIPAMNYFKNKNSYEVLTINGEQMVEKVHEDIIKALNLS